MAFIKQLTYLLLIFLALFGGIIIGVDNAANVQVSFLWWQLAAMPLGVVLIVTLLLGIIVGVLYSRIWPKRPRKK